MSAVLGYPSRQSRPKRIDVSNKRRSSVYSPASDSAPWRPGPSGPPSPALSSVGSMTSSLSIYEKSTAELIPLLKEAYGALRDKERDLLLAAEIGKSLLDNNIALKSKYEALLQQLQAYQEQQQQQRSTFTLSAPCTQPINIDNKIDSTAELNVISDNVISDNDIKSDIDATVSADGDAEFRPRQRRLLSAQKPEEVEALEQEKYELQTKLDTIVREAEAAERTHTKKMKRLENEVQSLRAELESATKKVLDLEEMNDKLIQKQRRTKQQQQEQQKESEEVVVHPEAPAELMEKIVELEQEQEEISAAKEDLEQKYTSTLKDLNALKEQFEQFQFTQNDYIALQEAFQRQLKHIAELNQSLAEHQELLQSQQTPNAWSRRQSPAPSESGESLWSQYGKGSDTGGVRRRNKQSLLSELENEFMKQQPSTGIESIAESEENVESSALEPASLTEKTLNSMYMSPAEMALESLLHQAGMKTGQMSQLQPMTNLLEASYADYDPDDYYYDERGSSYLTDIEEEDDADSNMALMQRNQDEVSKNVGFFGRLFRWIFRLIRRVFRMIWRWCRFWGVLVAAVLISIWKGPDEILEKESTW